MSVLIFLLFGLVGLSGMAIGLRYTARVVSCGLILSGCIVQVVNNFLHVWSTTVISAITTLSVLLTFSFRNLLFRSTVRFSPSRNRVMSGLAISLGLLVVFFLSQQLDQVSFVTYVTGEDNAKWANLLSQISVGHIDAGQVNGSGGIGTIFLVMSYGLQHLVGRLSFHTLSEAGHIVSSLFATYLLISLLIIVLCLTSHDGFRFRRSGTNGLVVALLVVQLMHASSFGFLTFVAALFCWAVFVIIHFSEAESKSNSAMLIQLLALFCASLTWLPLVVLLLPLVVLSTVKMFHFHFSLRSSFIFLLSLAVVFFAWQELVYPRLMYFNTKGSGGDPVWRELFIAGGGTPRMTLPFLAVVCLFVMNSFDDTDLTSTRFQNFRMIWALLLIPVAGVLFVAGLIHGDTSYSTQKLLLFTVLAVLVMTAIGQRARSNNRAFLPYIAALIFLLGGDFQMISARFISSFSIEHLEGPHQPWVNESVKELNAENSLPVGCITVDSGGQLAPTGGPDYRCSRMLSGISGGEERFIGILAFANRQFTAIEMANSLRHYLKEDFSDRVFVIDRDTSEVRNLVTIDRLIAHCEDSGLSLLVTE